MVAKCFSRGLSPNDERHIKRRNALPKVMVRGRQVTNTSRSLCLNIVMKNPNILALVLLLSGFSLPVLSKQVQTSEQDLAFENSRYVQLDDVRLHVRDWAGDNTGMCPVLLVHGFAGSTFSFRELAPALAKAGHPVLAVDLPGYGYSQRSAFSGKAAEALWQLLERERPGQSWCLLGHSMGAKLVGQVAALKPYHVQAIVYSDGSPLVSSERRKKWFSSSSFIRNAAIRWVEKHYLNEKKFISILSQAYARPATRKEAQGYLKPLLIPGTVTAAFSGYAKQWSDDIKPAQIGSIPSLIIWGDKDTWVKPEVGKTLAKNIPTAKFLMIPGAGHCPIETHFAKVFPAISQSFGKTTKAVKAQ
jgi:pimeloyl-ACP methyl ester carboxylesterase